MEDSNLIQEEWSFLLEFLRVNKGYSIQLEDQTLINKLLLSISIQSELPKETEGWIKLIKPVVCKTTYQQRNFESDVKEWLDRKNKVQESEKKLFNEKALKLKKEKTLANLPWQILSVIISVIILILILIFSGLNSPVNIDPETGLNSSTEAVSDPFNRTFAIPASNILYGVGAICIFLLLGADFNKFFGIEKLKKRQHEKLKKRLKPFPFKTDKPFDINVFFRNNAVLSFFQSIDLAKTIKRFNNPLTQFSRKIDIPKTINSTIRSGGFVQFEEKRMSKRPEYLILIDRKTFIDHHFQYVKQIISLLEAFDVHIDVFYFSENPTVSFSDNRKRSYSLKKLATLYNEHNLLIFSSGASLATSGNTTESQWLRMMMQWKDRALFTPEDTLTCNSSQLSKYFNIFPATQRGLEEFTSKQIRAFGVPTKRLPGIIGNNPLEWTQPNPPTHKKINLIIEELQEFLGEKGFLWLASCGIYPEIHINLTLYLGNQLVDENEEKLFEVSTLLNLMQLPWFRTGTMPLWLRSRLSRELPEYLEGQIQKAFTNLFAIASENQISDFSFNPGSFSKPHILKNKGDLTIQFIKREGHEYSPLKDEFFSDFLDPDSKINVPGETIPSFQIEESYIKRFSFLFGGSLIFIILLSGFNDRMFVETNDVTILGIIFVAVSFILITSQSTSKFWKRLYRRVPPFFFVYFIPAIFYWPLGIIAPQGYDYDEIVSFLQASVAPNLSYGASYSEIRSIMVENSISRETLKPFLVHSQLYFVASRYLLPAALILLTLSVDFKIIFRISRKLLILFIVGGFSIMISGIITFLLVQQFALLPFFVSLGELGQNGVLATILGSWIGGGDNQTAMREMFNVGDNLFAISIVIDVITANVWLGIILFTLKYSSRFNLFLKAEENDILNLDQKLRNHIKNKKSLISVPDALIVLAFLFGGVALSHWSADLIASIMERYREGIEGIHLESLLSDFFWLSACSIIIGIILSFTKAKELIGLEAYNLSSVFLYFLLATIGMKMNLGEVLQNYGLFIIGIIWLIIHAVILIISAKLLRAPLSYIAIVSQANIGGAVSAPLVGFAFSSALVPISALLTIVGYLIGSYGALLGAFLYSFLTS